MYNISGVIFMERADVMTDNQYYGILKMILMIIKSAGTKDEIEKKIESLLRDRDREDIRRDGENMEN